MEESKDYFDCLVERATKNGIPAKFLETQPRIANMRTKVIDWFIDVNNEYWLLPETHLLSSYLFDLYLSKGVAAPEDMQLIGTTCMFIAHKYEQVYEPNVIDYAYITDGKHEPNEIIKMEETILNTIEFNLAFPTMFYFLRCMGEVIDHFDIIEPFCFYLLYIATLDVDIYELHPAQLAASSIYLANIMFKYNPWDSSLETYSSYKEEDVKKSASKLNEIRKQVHASEYKAITRKFKKDSFVEPTTQSPLDAI
uniref:Cyclin A2 n=1 Tax=Clandestinovirus TaxID=2831644 RepID=A0A8F8PKB0_9VIRU|nr:cyclin A2 [Clandestinovirus]